MIRARFPIATAIGIATLAILPLLRAQIEERPLPEVSAPETFAAELSQIPKAPANRVRDDARAFTDPADLAEIVKMLDDFATNEKLDMYVAAYTFIGDENIDSRAARIKKEWADTPRGVVMVYERATERLTFSASDEIHGLITKTELLDIFRTAAASAGSYETPSDRMLAATKTLGTVLARRIAEYDAAGSTVLVHPRVWKLLALTILAIGIIGVAMAMISKSMGARQKKDLEFFYFPQARVDQRFGGSFAGGASADVTFAKRPQSD